MKERVLTRGVDCSGEQVPENETTRPRTGWGTRPRSEGTSRNVQNARPQPRPSNLECPSPP
eukprot:458948-Pyramimonas_sp.AAC.1